MREVVPANLPAAVLVVLHISPFQASSLPEIPSSSGALPACHAKNHAKIERDRIYVAPPDHHHLLIDGDRVAVKKGPKENRFRPSIDTLFRSAAYNYGPRAIGVVLFGALDDGTFGLWSDHNSGMARVCHSENVRMIPAHSG